MGAPPPRISLAVCPPRSSIRQAPFLSARRMLTNTPPYTEPVEHLMRAGSSSPHAGPQGIPVKRQGGGIETEEERQNTRMHTRNLKSTLAIPVRNASKSFPGVQALRGVNFELLTGEVHGLVGANGAGKSTFIKMLSGAGQPDTGEIEVECSPLLFEDSRRQRSAGIAPIYQQLNII